MFGVDRSKIRELEPDEADYELLSPDQLYGSHINLIPAASAVQAPRLFYGARFYNQAMPLKNPEAPLVQAASSDGPSFDNLFGEFAGAAKSPDDGVIESIDDQKLVLKTATGEQRTIPFWKAMPFNRKSGSTRTPLDGLAPGVAVKKGQMLAKSNFTDDKGNLALGVNARVGLIPYKGWSMDDAIAVSDKFAERMTSDHIETYEKDISGETKGGLNHFVSLFPDKYHRDQIKKLTPEGVVTPGTVLKKGDPIFLATRPKAVTSASMTLGKLSRISGQTRQDDSEVWEAEEDGVVTDVGKTKDGYKVIVQSFRPLKIGDKLTGRTGQKSILSKIIPEDQMPRSKDGRPLEVLLNPLALPSRVNVALVYEMLLGKIAEAKGESLALPSYLPKGEKWLQKVQGLLAEAGVEDAEELFDPQTHRMLENPVTTGNLYMSKLLHVAEDKISGRGLGGSDINQQPARGAGEGAQSKRVSGLEGGALLSAGAYKTLKEMSTVRGQQNQDFWAAVRAGNTPKTPGQPFVWDKFQALLTGAGFLARKNKGNLRLGPMTDRRLQELSPIEVRKNDLVRPDTLDPVAGGLFDPAMVGANKYGKISLPEPIPNPAMEDTIVKLLGMTRKQFRAILNGDATLDAG